MSTNYSWDGQPAAPATPAPPAAAATPAPPQQAPWPVSSALQANWHPAPAAYPFSYADQAAPRPRAPRANPFAWITFVLGLVAIGLTFAPYYQLSVSINPNALQAPASSSVTQEFNAWYGVFGWLGGALVLAAGVLALIKIVAKVPGRGLPAVATVASAAGLASTAAALFAYPPIANADLSGYGVNISDFLIIDSGYTMGYWAALGCGGLALIAALLLLITSNDAKAGATSAYENPGFSGQTSLVTAPSHDAQAAYGPPSSPVTAQSQAAYAPPAEHPSAAPAKTQATTYGPPTSPYAPASGTYQRPTQAYAPPSRQTADNPYSPPNPYAPAPPTD